MLRETAITEKLSAISGIKERCGIYIAVLKLYLV